MKAVHHICGEYLNFDDIQELFEKFVDWQQSATVMLREAVTVTSSFNGRVM
jgi:hypothetical protein